MGSHTTHLIRRPVSLLLAVLLSVPLVAAIPTAQPAAQAADKQFTFAGGGWGHAVGMSQYGAYAQAKFGGRSYDQILGHYYQGSSIADLGSDLPAAKPLWVNLELEATSVTLQAAGSGAADPVAIRFAGSDINLPVGREITVAVIGGTAGAPVCRLRTGDVEETGTCKVNLVWDGDTDEPDTRVVVDRVTRRRTGVSTTCRLNDWNTVPSKLRTCTYSRGSMHIRPDNNTASFHLVQQMDIDDYVLGISEMAYYWALPTNGPNGVEALKAQAVAARSYAAKRQIARGDPAGRAICWCHVYDTGADQRYVGWGHSGLGQQGWFEAVRSTDGEVLTHPAERKGGKLIPLETFYGSSTFGATEPSSLIFNLNRPYLVSVDDHWSLDPRVHNNRAKWTKTYTGSELAQRLGLGPRRTVVDASIRSCSPSGAAASIQFTDDRGNRTTVEIRKLRGTLGLSSPQVRTVNGATPCSNTESGASLVAGDLKLDDDESEDSSGNGDGVSQCGETVEINTEAVNDGSVDLSGLTGSITVDSTHVDVVHNTTSSYRSIPVGGATYNSNDWDLTIASSAPDGHTAMLRVTVGSSTSGPWVLEYPLTIRCGNGAISEPPLRVTGVTVDDGVRGDSRGNGDKTAQCGEVVELYIELENEGNRPLRAIEGHLRPRDSTVELLYNDSSPYPDLAAGDAADNTNDWDMAVAKTTQPGQVARFVLEVATSRGTLNVPIEVPIECGDTAAPRGGYRIAGLLVDDGFRGDSRGNGDRIAQCGETVELYVDLKNRSTSGRDGVSVTFASSDPHLSILYNKTSPYPPFAAKGTESNTNDWDLRLARNIPDGHRAGFTLRITDGTARNQLIEGELSIECGDDGGGDRGSAIDVSLKSLTIDDGPRGDSRGNFDRVAQCGETIELYVELKNRSTAALDDVTVRLVDDGPYIAVLYNVESRYPNLAAGGTAENLDDWDIRIDEQTPRRHAVDAWINVADGDGNQRTLPLPLQLTC